MASAYIGGGVATPNVDSIEPHTSAPELPPPITTLQAPASNAGSDDPSGGIAKGAGGLSSTAGIGSPVPSSPPQTVVGSVLESVFGKKERTAEEIEAVAPTTATVTTSSEPTTAENTTTTTTTASPGVLGAITGAAVAGGAAVASIIPGMSAQAPEAAVAPSSTETPGDETRVAESTTAEEVEATKQSVGAEKVELAQKEEQDPHAAEEAKKKEDHKAAVRENKDSIPTAGGEKLGTAHEGESKIIPEVPAPTPDAAAPGVASAAGQPDSLTADNTAKNTGSAEKSKTKFSDRLKKALHIGDKKNKA